MGNGVSEGVWVFVGVTGVGDGTVGVYVIVDTNVDVNVGTDVSEAV